VESPSAKFKKTFRKKTGPPRRSRRGCTACKVESRAPSQKGRQLPYLRAAVSRDVAQRKLIDDLLALFGGRTQLVMAHLIESGKLTLTDVKEAEKILGKLERKDKSQ
jgi:hypothetical protein